MSYEGDTFTYRAMPDRAPRQAERPLRGPVAEKSRLTGWDRLAQVEGALASLTEQVEQMGAMLRELHDTLESGKARLQAAPGKPVITVADAPEAIGEPQRVAPAVVQSMTQGIPEPPAPPTDVKVSFFADGGTKAVVGQAKVIQQ